MGDPGTEFEAIHPTDAWCPWPWPERDRHSPARADDPIGAPTRTERLMRVFDIEVLEGGGPHGAHP